MARLTLTIDDIKKGYTELVECFDGYQADLDVDDYACILERVQDIDPTFEQSDKVIEAELIDYIDSL